MADTYYIKTADGSHVVVVWKTAWNEATDTGSCLYHATADGKTPVCGTKVELGEDDPYDRGVYKDQLDRSRDLMTCDRCADRVYRVRGAT